MPELMLADAAATEAAGAALARAVAGHDAALCIHLEGELGAGKTTLARGFMRGWGHTGRVPSPTYTLVEPYEFAATGSGPAPTRRIWHLDLYRLSDPEELEYLGIAEMTEPGAVLLVEWPDRGYGMLPASDLHIKLQVVSQGRELAFSASGRAGEAVATAFAANLADG